MFTLHVYYQTFVSGEGEVNAAQDSGSTFLKVRSPDISDESPRLLTAFKCVTTGYLFMETQRQFPAVFMPSKTEYVVYYQNICSWYVVIRLEITPK